MNYSKTLHFITNILSLSVCPNRRVALKRQMQDGSFDWERVLQVSSEHLVLPALYVSLNRAKLLDVLPSDLQTYLEHITQLNRIRNQRNLEQASEINGLLNSHDIQPIFLKGTAHLLEGLYTDLGERMIGDIDFLVAPEKMVKTADLLVSQGYSAMSVYSSENFVSTKHYPRMIHKDKVFAIEIHKDVIQKVSYRQLDYSQINAAKRNVKGYFLPSYTDLLLHNMMNTQLNDNGFILSSLNLRQKYDFILLSQFEKPITVIKKFKHHHLSLISYLVKSAYLFDEVEQLEHPKNIWSFWVYWLTALKLKYPKPFKVVTGVTFLIWRMSRDLSLAAEYLPQKNKRTRVLKYIVDSEHRSIYFQQLFNRLKSL